MASASTTRLLLWSVLAIVLAASAAGGLYRLVRPGVHAGAAGGESLPVLGELPSFTLTERSGRTVGSADLKGRPWIASFVFTRCTGVCPAVSGAMAAVQARIRERGGSRARLVSFSVDPGHDTPEVLGGYARGFGADAERWWFLTGEKEPLYRLIRDGFRLSVAELGPGETAPPDGDLITHSDRMVLIDGELRIRGYYHGREPEAVAKLIADLERIDGN